MTAEVMTAQTSGMTAEVMTAQTSGMSMRNKKYYIKNGTRNILKYR